MFVNGDGGDDRLVGGEGEDRLAGGAGKDTLVGAGNDDDLDGDGAGRTAAQFALALQSKPFKVAPPAAPGGRRPRRRARRRHRRLRGPHAAAARRPRGPRARRIRGRGRPAHRHRGRQRRRTGPNVLLGDAGSNSLDGSARAPDVLDGRGGDDYLFGDGDEDTLLGGPGDDLLHRPGPGSSCGSGRDTLRGPRFAPAALRPLRFGACELVLSRGGFVSVKLTPVRLRAGVFTIHVTTALPADDDDDPVRFAIVTGSGRVVASRSVRIAGRRDRVQGLTLRLRGRPPSGSTVKLVMVERGHHRPLALRRAAATALRRGYAGRDGARDRDQPRGARGRRRRRGARVVRALPGLRAARPAAVDGVDRPRRPVPRAELGPPPRPRRRAPLRARRRRQGGRARGRRGDGRRRRAERWPALRRPWGNQVEIVDYRDIQFTKAPAILAALAPDGLEKHEAALEELARKGLAG